VQDAKARFSELLRAAKKEPQSITLRGEEAAVLVSAAEYRRLQGKGKAAKKSMTLLEALRACPYELEIPPRTNDRERDIGL
jgi:prevent-host-death family protein